MILEEDTSGLVVAVETYILDPNAIAAVAAANSDITNTTGVHYDRNAPTPIFTIKPTPEAEPDDEHEDSDDDEDEEYYDDDHAKLEELEPP